MKNAFGWLGFTTSAALVCLQGASFAADTQQSLNINSMPNGELLAQQQRFPGRNFGKGFRVPILDRAGGIPIVAVTLNGEKFPMLLDTGASMTMITDKMARASGFRQQGTERVRVADGRVKEVKKGTISSIKVGDVEMNNFDVLVGEVPLLGQNFFGEYNVTIAQDFVVFRERVR
ncbi:MAG: retropepsin-like aspartic protease [Potamolinea sp.]